MRRVACAVIAACALTAAPASADAAAGTVNPSGNFVAAPGTANDLTVSAENGGLRLTDPAGITGSFSCPQDRPGDPTTVLCGGRTSISSVDLGDGDDRLRLVGTGAGQGTIID